ncbi:hypothetical protein HSR6_1845 [Halodesulfurarchaeum formicicum]|uniref:Potassium channel domain-containing protein n=1 Tax=Halodesulfurarchaeum formicicum TaxID=1873524 RepID=A0A1J1AFB3_9EURY|nr:hypothetical protein HSR6_1845 [Halodesulfurarchaeum formicicum]
MASFKGAEFRGVANFSGAEFERIAEFEAVEFREEADLRTTEFKGQAAFGGAEFGGRAIFKAVTFEGLADFRKTTFEGLANFNAVQAGDWAFMGAEFERQAKFGNAEFGGRTNFMLAEFGKRANFMLAEFGELADFESAEFGGAADFNEAEFGGGADFEGVEFEEEVGFKGAEFWGEADFRGSSFEGNAPVFRGVAFEEGSIFADLTLDGTQFNGGDLTDATFTGTSLRNTNFESALLSRATFFDADLRGAKLSGAVLGDVRIDDRTRFLGSPSEDVDTSPHTFAAIRSRPACVYDPSYEGDGEQEDADKAKSVYRALEELGGKHARPRLQSRSFVRRQDLQKKNYWDDATANEASLEERLIAGARWSRAKVARATLLYGESPWRVIGYSLSFILGFAMLFPLGGWMKPEGGDPITYAQIMSNPAEILNSVYYSTLTFTALGFGDFKPVGFGRALTTIETGLGAVLLALFVFILGRRAAR